jgi:hypothetical protein
MNLPVLFCSFVNSSPDRAGIVDPAAQFLDLDHHLDDRAGRLVAVQQSPPRRDLSNGFCNSFSGWPIPTRPPRACAIDEQGLGKNRMWLVAIMLPQKMKSWGS